MILAHISAGELTGLLGAFSALLGVLGYISRQALALAKVITGHIKALEGNTLATYALSGRMKLVEDSLDELRNHLMQRTKEGK